MPDGISGIGLNSYSSSPISDNAGGQVNKDEFLKLLTVQLKNQNPLKPYDNQEFASQLAQFSQLEQLTDIRSLIEEQITSNSVLTQTVSNTALPGLLGKSAKAITNAVHFNGEQSVAFGFSLPYQVKSGELTITNEAGRIVKSVDLSSPELTSGDHKIIWDGKSDDGDTLPVGDYYFSVSANDGNGNSFTTDTYVYGKIESVRFKAEGTKLVIGGMEIPLENIIDISTEG